MYGALIVEPRDRDIIQSDRDYVVQLSDWSDDDPMQILHRLGIYSDVYNYNQPTLGNFLEDISANGLTTALNKRRMWNQMRMNPTDLADVSAATLTYLMNGTTPACNWRGLFKSGESVRLRFINGAAHTFFDVRIPELSMRVVQADGQNVEPITVDEFRCGPGETYDVLVEPKNDAYTIFAQSMDRSGYACGTLSVREGVNAPIPAVEPVQWLSMADMMGSMNHSSMSHSSMTHAAGMKMDHTHHAMSAPPLAIPSQKVRHARTEFGAAVDMRVDMPRTNLDDPGVGLRSNGRRVLTLADLHAMNGIPDARMPDREIELHLTGNMERYRWSIDGVEFGESTPVHMKQGERLRVIFHNDTMMTHPMHLHGMWSDLENEKGELLARRHTIPVQPAQRLSFLTTPDMVGRWAWHCHLMFHMHTGMFREVLVT